MISWSVLQVLTGKEQQVADIIKGLGIAYACVPARRLFERRNGRWQYVVKTLFPSYVFIETVMTAARYYQMQDIPNAIRFLGKSAGGLPEAVPEEQMRYILQIDAGKVDESIIVDKDERRRRATIRLALLDETKYIEVALGATSTPELLPV